MASRNSVLMATVMWDLFVYVGWMSFVIGWAVWSTSMSLRALGKGLVSQGFCLCFMRWLFLFFCPMRWFVFCFVYDVFMRWIVLFVLRIFGGGHGMKIGLFEMRFRAICVPFVRNVYCDLVLFSAKKMSRNVNYRTAQEQLENVN